MHRTQIYLHDELYQQLKLRSQRRGLSISELIRRAVEKDLHTEPADNARAFFDQAAPLQSFAEVEPESYVRELRSQSRLLREKHMTATFERLLLDTDIVIFLLKKDQARVERFLDLQEQSVIFLLSPLVVAEIYAGAFKREYPQIERFFGFCEHLQLDIETARLAGQYANQYRKAYQGISLEDYLLAATAKRNKCPLWTGNRKHYPMTDITLFTE